MLILFKFNKVSKAKKIIVAPLDWGIGHATRCIPLIDAILSQGHEPIIAASGAPLTMLRGRFPALRWTDFPGHSPTYSRGNSLMPALLRQSPAMMRQMFADHRFISQYANTIQADGVISDNRFGAYSNEVPSVFITHQINLLMPNGFVWSQPLARAVNRHIIRKYDACWIPDYPGPDNLSGELSYPVDKSLHATNIGPLSRFSVSLNQYDDKQAPPHILVMLSGPEPQRTLFENIIIKRYSLTGEKVVVLRGLPGHASRPSAPSNIQCLNHAGDAEMAWLITHAGHIVARAGYSTIMDLFALGRKALLVPTPGQSEQAYLAKWHARNGDFTTVRQGDLVSSPLVFPDEKRPFVPLSEPSLLEARVSGWLRSL